MEDTLAALTQSLLAPATLAAATDRTTGEVDEVHYSNLHRGLQTLLEIVPRATADLVSSLNKHYPFRKRGSDIQVYSVENSMFSLAKPLHSAASYKPHVGKYYWQVSKMSLLSRLSCAIFH